MEKVICALCGEKKTIFIFNGEDRVHKVPGRFRLVKCIACGLVYVNPRPNKEEINVFYPNDYGAHQELNRYKGEKRTFRQLIKRVLMEEYLGYPSRSKSLLKKIILFPVFCLYKSRFFLNEQNLPIYIGKGRMLDIGCGSGRFLDAMRDLGWVCYGVEPSVGGSTQAKEKELNVFTGDLFEAKKGNDSFDFIVMNQVLEHVYNPNEVLAEVRRILSPSGVLRISVPNYGSFVSKIFGSLWFNLDVPRHLYQFTKRTLIGILTKNGFKVDKIVYASSLTGALGSLEYLIEERLGVKLFLRRNRFIGLLLKPLVFIIDQLGYGDGICIYVSKRN